MKYLRRFDTEEIFRSNKAVLPKPYVAYTVDTKAIHLYIKPSFGILLDDEYDDKALISLTEKKQGIEEATVWSHNLASDVATIDGTTLRFLKHYEGDVVITATAGEYSDTKTVNVKCIQVPDSVTYTVVTAPSVKTVNWDETSAELSFVGKIVASYSDGHKPSETTQSTYNFTAEFPQNPSGSYLAVNTEYVDLGLPSGTKWAKCNLFAQTETEFGYYFQWADTNGYPTAGESTINRNGTYDWEGHGVDWTVKQKNQLSKVFNYNTTPYQTNQSVGTTASNTKFTKYLGSTTSTYKDPSATDEDALKAVLDLEDDAAHVHMGEGWRIPTTADTQELYNNTTSTWYPSGNSEFGGVAGRKFANKTDASKYIFVPAAGYAYDSSMYDVGSVGYIWSSSLYSSYPYCAHDLNFDSSNVHPTYNYGRFYGFSVRGVC